MNTQARDLGEMRVMRLQGLRVCLRDRVKSRHFAFQAEDQIARAISRCVRAALQSVLIGLIRIRAAAENHIAHLAYSTAY